VEEEEGGKRVRCSIFAVSAGGEMRWFAAPRGRGEKKCVVDVDEGGDGDKSEKGAGLWGGRGVWGRSRVEKNRGASAAR